MRFRVVITVQFDNWGPMDYVGTSLMNCTPFNWGGEVFHEKQ